MYSYVYICTYTDSQLTEQTSSVSSAAIRHKQSVSQMDGSVSKQLAVMSDNSQVSLQCACVLPILVIVTLCVYTQRDMHSVMLFVKCVRV